PSLLSLSLTSPPLPYTTLFRSRSLYRDPRRAHRRLSEISRVALAEQVPRCATRRSRSLHVPRGRLGPACMGLLHQHGDPMAQFLDRKSTRLNSSHVAISYAVFC